MTNIQLCTNECETSKINELNDIYKSVGITCQQTPVVE